MLRLCSDCARTPRTMFRLCSDYSDCPRTVLRLLGLSSESTWTMWGRVKYCDLATFSSMFQHQPKLQYDGSYASHGLIFDHGLLWLRFDLHSISPISAGIPSRILGLFKLSSSLDPIFLIPKSGFLKKASRSLSPQRRREQLQRSNPLT